MTASVNVGIRSLLNIVPRTPRHATTTQSLSSSADCHDDERHERRTTRAYRDPKQYTHKFKDEAPRRIPGDGGRRRGRGRRRRFEGHRHRGEFGESRVWCGVVWCGRAGRGGIRSFRASTSSGGDGARRGRSGLRIRHFRLGLSPPPHPQPGIIRCRPFVSVSSIFFFTLSRTRACLLIGRRTSPPPSVLIHTRDQPATHNSRGDYPAT